MAFKLSTLRFSALLGAFCGSIAAQSPEIHNQLLDSERAVLAYAGIDASQRSASSQTDFDYTRELLKATARNPAFSSDIRQKAAILEGWSQYLASEPNALVRKPAPVLLLDYRTTEAGESCEQAIAMSSGSGIRLDMAGSESIWMRITLAEAHGINISTRGSTVDAKVSVFADCRVASKEPFVTADDNFGLQADAAVPAGKQLFWMAKIENLSAQPGQIVMTAPNAVVVTGTVRQAANLAPISNVDVGIFRVNGSGGLSFENSTRTSTMGTYSISTSVAGTFALRTGSSNTGQQNMFVPEAFEDRLCSNDNIFDFNACGTEGNNFTPVTLLDAAPQTINFQLERAPLLVGSITNTQDGSVIAGARLVLFNQINCNANTNNTVFSGCNFAAATVLSVTGPSDVTGIDFTHRRIDSRQVRIVSAKTRAPIPGTIVDIWTSNGLRADSKATDANGDTWVYPNTLSNSGYYASTDNSAGHIEQVYQNRDCQLGSAFNGLCGLLNGTLIQFPQQANSSPIVFQLKPVGTQFVDGFED